MSYPSNIFHTSSDIAGSKKYTNNLTGTRLKVYIEDTQVCLVPQNGGAAFTLSLAQFRAATTSHTYEEGWQ